MTQLETPIWPYAHHVTSFPSHSRLIHSCRISAARFFNHQQTHDET